MKHFLDGDKISVKDFQRANGINPLHIPVQPSGISTISNTATNVEGKCFCGNPNCQGSGAV